MGRQSALCNACGNNLFFSAQGGIIARSSRIAGQVSEKQAVVTDQRGRKARRVIVRR